jgi:hypothetical protein
MDTNENAIPPEPTPTHEAGPWNVHRSTLIAHAHDVNGVRYIGGAGQRLEEVLRVTWINEAHQLADDLTIAFRYLPQPAIRAALLQIQEAAEMTLAMRGEVLEAARSRDAEPHGDDEGGAGRRARSRRDAARALDEARQGEEGAVVA